MRPYTWLHPNASQNVRFLLHRGRRPYMTHSDISASPFAVILRYCLGKRTTLSPKRRLIASSGNVGSWQSRCDERNRLMMEGRTTSEKYAVIDDLVQIRFLDCRCGVGVPSPQKQTLEQLPIFVCCSEV